MYARCAIIAVGTENAAFATMLTLRYVRVVALAVSLGCVGCSADVGPRGADSSDLLIPVVLKVLLKFAAGNKVVLGGTAASILNDLAGRPSPDSLFSSDAIQEKQCGLAVVLALYRANTGRPEVGAKTLRTVSGYCSSSVFPLRDGWPPSGRTFQDALGAEREAWVGLWSFARRMSPSDVRKWIKLSFIQWLHQIQLKSDGDTAFEAKLVEILGMEATAVEWLSMLARNDKTRASLLAHYWVAELEQEEPANNIVKFTRDISSENQRRQPTRNDEWVCRGAVAEYTHAGATARCEVQRWTEPVGGDAWVKIQTAGLCVAAMSKAMLELGREPAPDPYPDPKPLPAPRHCECASVEVSHPQIDDVTANGIARLEGLPLLGLKDLAGLKPCPPPR